MPTLRDRVTNYLFPEKRLMEQEINTLIAKSHVKEASADLFNKLVTSADYIQTLPTYTTSLRLQDINNAYQLYYTNQTVQGIVDRYLDYGVGNKVSIISSNEEVVTEALKAVRNRSQFGTRNFRNLGVDFINEGELLFILWYDEATKLTTISRLPTKDVEIIWADPITMMVPSFYVFKSQEGDVLYRDWRTQDDVLSAYLSENEGVIYADNLESNLLGLQHVGVWCSGIKRNVTSGRGMPLLNSIFKNAEYLSQFDDQRFAVASRAATYTEDYTINSGAQGLQDFINRESASVAPYGSGFVGNEPIDREWNNNPTGSNSERFNQHIWLQGISSATGLNGAILGVPSMLSNRSVLDKLMEIFHIYVDSFQNILSDVIREVFEIVIIVSTNPGLFGTPELFMQDNTLELMVSLDTPIDLDVPTAINYISQQYGVYEQLEQEGKDNLIQLEKLVYDKLGVKQL